MVSYSFKVMYTFKIYDTLSLKTEWVFLELLITKLALNYLSCS
jgi:hypothetical protein